MPNLVIASNNKAMPKLDGSLKHKVHDFFEKLNADHTSSSLHIEPIVNSKDSRVRTARVDQQFRAILFRIEDKGNLTYLYMGTWPHDEAVKIAGQSELKVNPVNGVLEGIIGTVPDEPASSPDQTPLPPTATASPPIGYLAQFGYTITDLTDGLGLDTGLAARALLAVDDHVLTDVATDGVGWQGCALLDLATGESIESIRQKYSLDGAAVDPSLSDDEQILKALEHPSSKMQFAFIEDNEELRRVIDGGDFAAWRIFLHPEQRRYATDTWKGPFRLSGGAGTGKTVVAVHRARHLSSQNPARRVVLTTYNAALALGLNADLTALDPGIKLTTVLGAPGVHVRGIDSLGWAVLSQADADRLETASSVLGQGAAGFGPTRTQTETIWRDVLQAGDTGLKPALASPAFLESEYVAVVLANKVTSLEQYAKIPRPGRGVRLSRPQRIAVWKLVEAFRRRSQMDGTISFPEVLAVAAEVLRLQATAGQGHMADHVIIDEAQDLHAAHWLFLRALVAEGPDDLFIAEDSHQRIYGQPVVLSRFGIKIVGRSRRLTLNYRTTAQNLHLAVSILSGAEYTDLEQEPEDATKYRSARTGPNPELVGCASQTEEMNLAAERIKGWLADDVEPSTIAVLTRSQDDRDRFVRGLGERGVEAHVLDKAPSTRHPQVLTMHRAKGMEFSRVILASVDDKHLPSPATLKAAPAEEHAEAYLRERSLLYVAASRARDELVVTWSGQRSALLGTGE